MRIGISVKSSYKEPLRKSLEYAVNQELDYIEIKLEKPELVQKVLNNKALISLRNELSDYNLDYVMHAPYVGLNLASLDPSIGKISEKTIEHSVILASKVGIETVTVHVGRLPRDYPTKSLPKAIECAIERLRYLKNLCDDLGIVLAIENDHQVYDHLIAGYPDQIQHIIKSTDCKFTFDVGHAYTLTDPLNFIRLLHKDIVVVHLHDNMGDKDLHLGIGEGRIDFNAIIMMLKRFNYHGPLIIDVYDSLALDLSISRLRSILRKLVSNKREV